MDHIRLSREEIATRWLIPLGIFCITFLAFLPALRGGFVWDDHLVIQNNPNIHSLAWSHLQRMFTPSDTWHYVPLLWIARSIEYMLWGENPFGYHFVNVLLHSINAVLVYFLAQQLLRLAEPAIFSKKQMPLYIGSCFAALLFGIHHLRAEPVTWISAEGDALSGLFFISAISCYLKAYEKPQAPIKTSCWRLLSIGCYALSLLSKEIGVTLPMTLIILDVYPLRRYKKGAAIWIEKIPYLLLALAVGTAFIVGEYLTHGLLARQDYGFRARLTQAVYGLAFYISKTFCPLQLSPFYVIPYPLRPLDPQFVSSGLAVLMITWLFIKRRHQWPWGLPIWAFYIVTLSPVLGFLAYYFHIVADRYSYLPSLGWAVLAGAGIASLWRSWLSHKIGTRSLCAAMSGALAVLAGLSVATWRQTKVWNDELSLWKRTAQINPNSFFEEYELTLKINPNNANAHNNLGALLALDGRLQEAMAHFQKAVSLKPNNAEYRNNLQKAEAGMAKTHTMEKGRD